MTRQRIPQHRDYVTEPPEGQPGTVRVSGYSLPAKQMEDGGVWYAIGEGGVWKYTAWDTPTAATFYPSNDEQIA